MNFVFIKKIFTKIFSTLFFSVLISFSVGNDLSTPRPEYHFPGLNPGDFWCLCASRWLEAFNNGKAPMVKLSATNIETLKICQLEDLIKFAIDKPVNDN